MRRMEEKRKKRREEKRRGGVKIESEGEEKKIKKR